MNQAILDPVSEALQNLKQRRDELDRAIAALERIRLPGLHLRRRMISAPANDPPGEVGVGLNLGGMTLASAIITVLECAQRPLGNAEIVDALIRGGMRFRGTNPPLAVAQGLSRMTQKPGPVRKLGRGRWTVDSHQFFQDGGGFPPGDGGEHTPTAALG